MALDRMIGELPSPIADELTQVIRMVDLEFPPVAGLSSLATRIGREHFTSWPP
jgi:hypothetical protein